MSGGGGVPAHTTSETTVNQSPWQNKTYQALMLGTKTNPGPITSMLRNASNLTAQYNAINKQGITRDQLAQMSSYNPQQTAADGGIMALQGYAKGGKPTPKSLTPAQTTAVKKLDAMIAKGVEPPPALVAQVNKIESSTGRNVSPFVDTGTAPVNNPSLQKSMAAAAASPTYPQPVGAPPAAPAPAAPPPAKPLNPAEKAAATTYYKDIAKGTTPPQKVIDKINAAEARTNRNVSPLVDTGKAPVKAAGIQSLIAKAATSESFPKSVGDSPMDTIKTSFPNSPAAQTYTQAVEAKQTEADAAGAVSGGGDQKIGLLDTMRKIANYDPKTGKSTLPDFLALQEKIRNLKTPAEFDEASKQYGVAADALKTLTQYTPEDIKVAQAKAQEYTASTMKAPEEFAVTTYDAAKQEASKFGDVSKVEGQAYDASTMAKTAREEASTAAGPKSWTDAGTAEKYMSPYMQNVVDIEKREAARDYAQELQKLKAGASGVGAFGGSRQAIMEAEAQRNYAQKLADIQAKGQQEAYQSGMGQFTTEQGLTTDVEKANAQMKNTLKDKYMDMGMTEAAADQKAENDAKVFAATSTQEAQKSNQAAELTKGAAQLQADVEKAKADQDAINQQRQLKVQQDLEAAKTFYGGQLTAEQANQVAKNSEAQFNAENRQQIELANQQTSLAEQQANQGAETAAAQIRSGAAQGMSGVAQGMASVGAEKNRVELANAGALGQSAEAQQNLTQSAADAQTSNVRDWLNMPNTINQPVVSAINAQPASGGTSATSQTSAPASPFARGGSVNHTRAYEAWLAARGKPMDRRGIGARG